jgi:hypothetical protein
MAPWVCSPTSQPATMARSVNSAGIANPFNLALGREDGLDALQAVTKPDFPNGGTGGQGCHGLVSFDDGLVGAAVRRCDGSELYTFLLLFTERMTPFALRYRSARSSFDTSGRTGSALSRVW